MFPPHPHHISLHPPMLFKSSSSCLLFILFVPHASPSSMVLWPSCGPRCLWPADMSRLHSTVLHSAPSLFPCPCSLSPFGPLPRCSLLLSLKSVTPHCLFILFGTLSSFHLLFFITTVTWRGGHVLSHVVGFYLFLTTDGWSSEYRTMEVGGVCFGVCMTCFWLLWACVRKVW